MSSLVNIYNLIFDLNKLVKGKKIVDIPILVFYPFQFYNIIPLRTNGEVIVEKVGGGEVCFNSSFLSYSIVISSHKKIRNIIISITRKSLSFFNHTTISNPD